MASNNIVGSDGFLTAAGGWNPNFGTVYLAASSAHPGQVKLGSTTLELNVRLRKFQRRYELPDVRPLFAMKVHQPALIEDVVARQLCVFRVSGRTKGVSNEWYRVEPEHVALQILLAAQTRALEIFNVDLFGQKYSAIRTVLGLPPLPN